MGLDVSHGAFSGAYSSFNRFRQTVAKAMGGSFPPHEDTSLDHTQWYWGEGCAEETHPGLYAFLIHSDCDGEIPPETCGVVADELEALLPRIEIVEVEEASGHIHRAGGYVAVTKRFIEGCRKAMTAGEPLSFY